MKIKLEKYDKLPVDRKFLASMPPDEIFKASAILITDPLDVW